MEDIREKKKEIRDNINSLLGKMPDDERSSLQKELEKRLFGFANFKEANISLVYIRSGYEIDTREIIKKSLEKSKIVVLPTFDVEKHRIGLMKIDDVETDLLNGSRNFPEPNPSRCKSVPIDSIDIAIIPGFAFDEKGGRIGSGEGYYDRFIPNLPNTTRKVALAYEAQIVPQVPMESHDKYVDIIITEKRIIYKI